MYRPAFQNALDFHADIIIIMLGTNDANPQFFWDIDNFVSNYKTLILALQTQSSQIWIVMPPPIFDDSMGPKAENLVNGVLPRIQQVADELNLPTVNVYPLLLDHPDYFWDGVHPDWQGAKVVANEVYRVVFGGTTHL
jgi:lysophospholipase L1-like esterase